MELHLLRLVYGRRRYYLLAALLLLLSACNTVAPDNTQSAKAEPDYLLTVPLAPGDTKQAIAQRHGGEVVVWEASDYAVVGLDSAASRGLATQNLALDPNLKVFKTNGQAAWMSGRSRTWAGGRSRTWAGGASYAWTTGTSALWSNGQYLWLPENTALWQKINLQQGHALAKNLGYGVKVAVIDTGVDLAHPALLEALAPAPQWKDFYGGDNVPQEEGTFAQPGYGHGTEVAGIIRQIAPRATILPIRVLGPDGSGDILDLTAAIQYAVAQGAHVINLSLGSDMAVAAVEAAINSATRQGRLVVASTGNTGDTRVSYPASSATMGDFNLLRLSVTSVNAYDRKSDFATYGPSVELAAPGENVYGPAPGELVAAWSGTSMAAPMASGALALALGQRLKVPAANLADELRVRAADIYNNGLNASYKDMVGKGRLNLEEFLRNVAY